MKRKKPVLSGTVRSIFSSHSLLFWYVHLLLCDILPLKVHPLVAIAVLFSLSLPLMLFTTKANKYLEKYTKTWAFWFGVIIMIYAGVLFPDRVISPLFYGIGIVVSLNYHALIRLIEKSAIFQLPVKAHQQNVGIL